MTLKLSLGNGHDQHLTETGHGIIRSKVKVTLTFNEKNTIFCNNFELVAYGANSYPMVKGLRATTLRVHILVTT